METGPAWKEKGRWIQGTVPVVSGIKVVIGWVQKFILPFWNPVRANPRQAQWPGHKVHSHFKREVKGDWYYPEKERWPGGHSPVTQHSEVKAESRWGLLRSHLPFPLPPLFCFLNMCTYPKRVYSQGFFNIWAFCWRKDLQFYLETKQEQEKPETHTLQSRWGMPLGITQGFESIRWLEGGEPTNMEQLTCSRNDFELRHLE